MKREETYIPYKERTPKELCRDINLKAESLFLKNDKYGLLFFALAFLGLVALHLYYTTYVYVWLGFLVVGLILAGGLVFFKTYSSKNDKFRRVIWSVALFVCIVMEWQEKTSVNWLSGAIIVGTIVVVISVFFKINQRMVNDMNLAPNPKRLLPIAKRLKKSFQLRNFICLALLLWLPFLTIDDILDEWVLGYLIIIFLICALFGNRDFWIDSSFNEDLDELEFRFEE